ncbi:hypothetical protein FB567DRAFT_523793 [Paraphoma chrysanthemicola]|uniref:Uncharacterized protein n=1 Tax=Paraphoma chrysanthemicola TaxID=798071 RepID=A0A8K0R5I3_9PLEO|nr:hypothetical protein FB567DRAFT_523793 [Paraphoma chrysanthemicola]
MPHLHNYPLSLAVRFRAHSDPTPLPTRSFTVDRSSTKHTVWTVDMIQLDGTSESKPVRTPTKQSTPSPPSTQRSGVRKSFANVFGSKKRTSTGLSNVEADDDDVPEDARPMRIISPRVTECDPLASSSPATTTRTKSRTFSFKNRHSGRVSQPIAAVHALPKVPQLPTKSNEEEVMSSGVGHLLVTDMPYQSPMRAQPQKNSLGRDGGALPASPTREAALHSHPVGEMVMDGEYKEVR